MIESTRALDISHVLGCKCNVDKLRDILNVIKATNWDWEPASMSLSQAYGTNLRGRDGDFGAGFVFYDPFALRGFPQREYKNKLVQASTQAPPAGHHTGFAYDEVIEGWNGRTYNQPSMRDGEEPPEPRSAVEYYMCELQRLDYPDWYVDPIL